MSFGGPPITVETAEEADELLRKDEKDSAIGKQFSGLRMYILFILLNSLVTLF